MILQARSGRNSDSFSLYPKKQESLDAAWLVNALACRDCFRAEPSPDRSRPVRVEDIDEAREQLIRRRATHLDQLANILSEERVRRVILPMLSEFSESAWAVRDLEYVRDLGLMADDYPVRMANPIYTEVIPRELVLPPEATLAGSVDPAWYVQPDGSLDLEGLLSAFQDYFREHTVRRLPLCSRRSFDTIAGPLGKPRLAGPAEVR